ncbi:FIG000325: clustered with transcription termination protein NusA [hydrothermal vent metagenome]|uniref:FIG000325: clustered with transcription termination protein NusA n=1 Tax=hydrothermal vent metagenome TaxID=652676 RepID=A0A3B1E9H6_9ZZZZ
MNSNSTINTQISQKIKDLGFLLYCIENVTENHENIFRVNIYSDNKAITLKDCTIVHKAIYPLLEDNIANKYTIQVGSVGIERPLLELRHYELVINQNIQVRIKDAKKVIGELKEVLEDKIKVLNKNNELIDINFSDIHKAKTLFVDKI